MTRGLGLRQYRACVRCRSRKTRCDFKSVGEAGKPPCVKCANEGADCVLASSRRGGDFTRYRRSNRLQNQVHHHDTQTGSSTSSPTAISTRASKRTESPAHDSLQNPSDALMILAHAVEEAETIQVSSRSPPIYSNETGALRGYGFSSSDAHQSRPQQHNRADPSSPELYVSNNYAPVSQGKLSLPQVTHLLQCYAHNYHQFYPIAPKHTLHADNVLHTMQTEPFLLTTMILVASKHSPELKSIHATIREHLRQLILDVVFGAPGTCTVGSVQGLLILGEWTELDSAEDLNGGEGAAWSLIGLAVRLAYFLRLEDSSFKSDEETLDERLQRERLAWTFTYLSDRQISIRTGQAFWCRGPSLSSKFTVRDFPSLQAQSGNDEDFASLLQAHVELTTLFGNVHDILFASRSRTAEIMCRGDYSKYIDDASKAMMAWHQSWSTISVSSQLKSCLSLSYQYLRMYVNAFAFQAVLYRCPEKRSPDVCLFPDSAMASPDARHVYTAIEAAETMVQIVAVDIDPAAHLRYMPARFYLYMIHAAVFLYKAHAVGATGSDDYARHKSLITRFISVLRRAAGNGTHIASRYARMLEYLWLRRQSTPAVVDGRVYAGAETVQAANQDDLTVSNPMAEMLDYDEADLQLINGTDPFESLLAMPPVFLFNQHDLLYSNE